MDNYVPPFTITNTTIELIASIMKKIGQLENYKDLNKMPILRRNNRIRSIHSSLAIEANSLSLNQVKDIINGKIVIGPLKEIQEVKNAYKAYEMIDKINPYSVNDLKKIHGIMTYLTVDESGDFRKGDEGVFDGNKCIFIAPKPDLVDSLMKELFNWLKKNENKIHPLILSSVLHYEFVFIHPFSDGNGRMARLWQNVILSKWEKIFAYVPIETEIKEYQEEYYKSIQTSNLSGDSTKFIEFMLKMINEVLEKLIESTQKTANYTSTYVKKLLEVMDDNIPMTSIELMKTLRLKSRKSFRQNYLKPAIENGLIKMTEPNNPTSRNQRYYKI